MTQLSLQHVNWAENILMPLYISSLCYRGCEQLSVIVNKVVELLTYYYKINI